MKTLYIPTSSFNFNGILSTGNLSPAAFYPLRNYGARSISKIKFNQLDNCLLAYDCILWFKYDGYNDNDFPIFLEVNIPDDSIIEIQLAGNFEGISVYRISEPVYITSKSCFIFRTEDEKNTAINNSLRDLKVKLLDQFMYPCKSLNRNDSINGRHVSSEFEVVDAPFNNIALQKDMIYNRIKGLYFGYLIGRFNSDSDEWTVNKILLNEIKISTQALIQDFTYSSRSISKNAFDKRIRTSTESIKRNLESLQIHLFRDKKLTEELFEQYYRDFANRHKIAVNYNDFAFVITGLLFTNQILPPEVFFAQVIYGDDRSIGYNIRIINQIVNNLSHSGNASDQLNSNLKSELINQVKDLEVEFSKLYSRTQKLNNGLDNPGEAIKFTSGGQVKSFTAITDFDQEPLMIFLNYLINHNEYDSKTSLQIQSKNELIDQLGKIYSGFFKDEWLNMSERRFLFLLKNLVDGKSVDFSLNEINDIVIKSFATYIIKSDCVVEIMDLLERNSISDKSIATAIWGAINGFSGIPKTVYDPWYESQSQASHVNLENKLDEILYQLRKSIITIYEDVRQIVSEPPADKVNDQLVTLISKVEEQLTEVPIVVEDEYKSMVDAAIERISNDKRLSKYIDWISKCLIELPEKYKLKKEERFQGIEIGINEIEDKKNLLFDLLKDDQHRPSGFAEGKARNVIDIVYK